MPWTKLPTPMRLSNDLGDYVDGAFADGIISEAEAVAIEKYINTLNKERSDIDAQYAKLFANTYLSGVAKTNLLNAKITFCRGTSGFNQCDQHSH